MPPPTQAHSFVAAIRNADREPCLQESFLDPGYSTHCHRSPDGRLEVLFSLRRGETLSGTRLILGDDSEWRTSLGESCMAFGTFVEFDTSRNHLKILSSIVGLPPLFIYRDPALTLVTTDLYLLTRIPGVDLHFNAEAISDLCRTGHPLSGMTLFREASMVPGGYAVVLEAGGQLKQARSWAFGKQDEVESWNAYTELQAGAVRRALGALDVSSSFLSLTAGLDTRAIMALLVAEKKTLPAYTLSGETLTIDARTAGVLCRAYGFPHTTVVLDEGFFRDLPKYATEASRLSGGLASLDQAHEVYLYRSVARDRGARLSGNLGNQVARRGVERMSMRNADLSILSDQILSTTTARDHWYASQQLEGGALGFEFLIRSEVPYSSVGNYCIGNYFAIQQTPYANRGVIENVTRMPKDPHTAEEISILKLRLRDLKHRFLGQVRDRSFQVRVIKEAGGYLASYPINWGWRATGGVSLKGLTSGVLAFLDALAWSQRASSKALQRTFRALGISGLHEYKHTDLWLTSFLKDFVHDTLRSSTTRESGLFNNANLVRALEEHYSGRKSHEKEIMVALDLALAGAVFDCT